MNNAEYSSSLKKNKNFIELIAFDKDENITYLGTCKIVLNRLSKILFIEPHNEDYKLISASFEWKYVCKKNILFVLAEHSFQDLALIFNNEARCKKVYNFLCKNKKSDVTEDSLIYERILFLMIKGAASNASNIKLRETLIQWIKSYNGNAKKEFLKKLKDNDICYDFLNLSDNGNQQKDCMLEKTDSRKRQYSAFYDNNRENFDNSFICDLSDNERILSKRQKPSHEKNYTKCLTEYKHVFIRQNGSTRRRLIIFTSTEKINYYEYYWHYSRKLYLCSGCRAKYRQTSAITEKNDEENEILKIDNSEHCCEPKGYNPAGIYEMKTLKKPDYKIIENGSLKLLIVFYSADKTQCYEYGYHKASQRFKCNGCKALNKGIAAKLCHNTEDDEEYVELFNDNHICEPREYEPEKYSKINEFVLKPNFEIRNITENGAKKKILVVLDGNDKKLCRVYHYSNTNKQFICSRCMTQHRKFVTAKLNKNEDGEEYVILSLTKHLCAIREYVPETMDTDNDIIKLPNFEYMEKTSTGAPKLFIFVDNDRSKCYTYSKIGGTRSNRYYCVGCHKLANGNNVKLLSGKEIKGIVYVQLCQDNEGKHYIRLEERQKHLCKPSNYKPEYYQIKQNITSFFLYKTSTRSLSAAIYHPNESNLCYTFYYSSSLKYFDCHGCQKKKKHALARLHKGDNGNEYFIHDFKKHVCKPTKVSILKQSGIKILEKSGLTLEGFAKKKEVDESKIVREPNFKFRENRNGVPDGNLIILYPGDKNFYYEYYKQAQYYVCRRCKTASAKLNFAENGEKFITLGKNEHQCEPIKCEKDENIIMITQNYEIFNQDFDNKPKTLIMFTSSTQELCYEMTYFSKPKNFQCSACKKLKQTTTAVLCQDEGSDKKCIQLLKNHICEPLKFDEKNYQPRKLLENGFELQSNEKNEPKLVIFSNAKQDMGYEYYLLKDNIYKCLRCEEKKRLATAELCKENGKIWLKLGNNQHGCIPKKVFHKTVSQNEASLGTMMPTHEENTAENTTSYSNIHIADNSNNATKKSYNFKLFEYQRNEKICQKLIVFVEDDERGTTEMCYIYVKLNDTDNNDEIIYECCQCRKNCKRKTSVIQLMTDSQGKEYVDLTKDSHTCAPQKFDAEKFKERQKLYKPNYKIIERTNEGVKKRKLFIFDTTNKDFCYEYLQHGSSYQCTGCFSKSKYTAARIYYYQTEKEYVEIYNNEHVCKLRLYNPSFKDDVILTEPDFEIQSILRNGKTVKRLIIFDPKDRDYCYEYNTCSYEKMFICSKCNSKGEKIYATLIQDGSGNECVKTSSTKEHVCEPQIYVREADKTEVTISITNFKIIPAISRMAEKLLIFTDDQQKLCYELSTSGSVYYCLQCAQKKLRYSVKFHKNDETGECFLTMKNHYKHVCKPIKYNSDKYNEPTIVNESDYIFYFNKEKEARLLIFTSQEQTLCYQYKLRSDGFVCIGCIKNKKYKTTAKLQRIANGDEYIELGSSKHVCKPIKYSSIKSSIKEIAKSTDIIAEKVPQHEKTVTEFELRDDENGNEKAILITFASPDKMLCYKHKFRNSDKKYLCVNCNIQNVYAKLYTSVKGESYVVMGQNEHQCDPLKYDEIDEKKIYDFKIFNRNDKKRAAKVIVFIDDEKNLCYEYSNQKGSPYFACTGCTPKKKIQVKLLTDKDGQEYVITVSKIEHFCSPIVFDPKKYEDRPTMTQSQFEIFSNIKGVSEKKLIVFDENDHNFGYDYNFNSKAFSCGKCLPHMKRISVILHKNENGENFLECVNTEHVCQILNLYETGRIIYPSNYTLENNTITTQHPTDVNKCYKFEFDDKLQAFCCMQCREKNKVIGGKICKKNNGIEFFLLAFDHFCKPLQI